MGYNLTGAPSLSSFAEAKDRFEHTEPIRRHKDKVRPLGYRRYHNAASIDMPDADTVVLKYYGTPFVTWRSDNTFTVSNDTHQSASAATHLSYFLPVSWVTRWDKCRMTICRAGKSYLMPEGSRFHFAKVDDKFDLINKPVAHALRKKRGIDKALLTKCHPFLDWLTVVLPVNNNITNTESEEAIDVLRSSVGLNPPDWYHARVTESTREPLISAKVREQIYAEHRMIDHLPLVNYAHFRSHWYHTSSCEKLLHWVTDESADRWVLAMYLIAEKAGGRSWLGDGVLRYNLSVEQATKFLLEMIRHVHRHTIFYKEQLDDGVMPSRSNAVYFNSFSFSSEQPDTVSDSSL